MIVVGIETGRQASAGHGSLGACRLLLGHGHDVSIPAKEALPFCKGFVHLHRPCPCRTMPLHPGVLVATGRSFFFFASPFFSCFLHRSDSFPCCVPFAPSLLPPVTTGNFLVRFYPKCPSSKQLVVKYPANHQPNRSFPPSQWWPRSFIIAPPHTIRLFPPPLQFPSSTTSLACAIVLPRLLPASPPPAQELLCPRGVALIARPTGCALGCRRANARRLFFCLALICCCCWRRRWRTRAC